MDSETLMFIANQFWVAVHVTAARREFYCKRDRLYGFPKGCCDDAADMFGYYLLKQHCIAADQINGVYYTNDGIPEYHSWIRLDNGIIIDLTAGQFWNFKKNNVDIYVGKEEGFYEIFSKKTKVRNAILESVNERLMHNYKMICKNME